MTRSWVEIHGTIAVILWSLILVPDDQPDGRAEGDSEFRTRLDLDLVLLVARRRQSRLTWSAPCHLWLDVGFGELHARWHTVDNASDAAAVGLAICGDSEIFAKCRHLC